MNMELLKIKKNNKNGFSLVEIVISIGLFGVLVSFLMAALVQNNRQEDFSIYKRQAIFLAEEGSEAVRNIRDADYTNLIAGTYGISENGDEWSLSGSSDQLDDFTRIITITEVDEDRRDISVDVGWNDMNVQNGTVTVATRLTNWMVPSVSESCVELDASGADLSNGNRRLNEIYLSVTDPLCIVQLDKATVTWTNNSRRMRRINLDNNRIWRGNVTIGTEADVDNTIITFIDSPLELEFRFDGNMNSNGGNIFSITLEFTDGTTVTESNIDP